MTDRDLGPRNRLSDGSVDFGNGIIGPSAADVDYFNSLPEKDAPSYSQTVDFKDGKFSSLVARFLRAIPRPVRRPVMATTLAVGIGTVVACGGNGEKPNNPDNTPTIPPSPTRTVAPTVPATATATLEATATAEPTPEPTPELEIPTFDEVLSAYRVAYSKLDNATLASLPENQTFVYVERFLRQCNEEGLEPGTAGVPIINTCAGIARDVLEVPGANNIGEFGLANQLHGLFTVDKANSLYKQGRMDATEQEFNEFMQTIRETSFPYYPK